MLRFTFILLLTILQITVLDASIERRAAIDIGSGGTKVAIADVDRDTNQIVHVLFEKSFSVPYQASLDKSEDGTFDAETRSLGVHTFKEIKEIANQHQVQKIKAIATSAFRKANNASAYVKEVEQQTGISIHVIPQREEGEIAFFSALATGEFDPSEVVVWDIGTGSMQITTLNSEGEMIVYMGERMGSVAFVSYIIDTIQDHDLDVTETPNPMSEVDVKQADRYARAFGRKAYPIIKQKIKQQKRLIGIGRLFYYSIRPLAAKEGVITRKGLRSYISSALDKTDEELNNPYAKVDVSNCILALAIMKALHIQEILPVKTTTTRGMLVYPSYWSN